MKFILTKELGRLATWLRILGYDTLFYRDDNLSTLIITALREERIILTRNSRISRFCGPRTIKVQSDFVEKQISQVLDALKLRPEQDKMFTRCVICNLPLRTLAKEAARGRVPEYVHNTQECFLECAQCKRVYWQGTHWGNVKKYMKKIGLSINKP